VKSRIAAGIVGDEDSDGPDAGQQQQGEEGVDEEDDKEEEFFRVLVLSLSGFREERVEMQ
jgi:hypothetical protein